MKHDKILNAELRPTGIRLLQQVHFKMFLCVSTALQFAVCFPLWLRPFVTNGDKGKFRTSLGIQAYFLWPFTQCLGSESVYVLIFFSSAHYMLHHRHLCLFGMIVQEKDWGLRQFFNRADKGIIYISHMLFLSFCFIKRVISLLLSTFSSQYNDSSLPSQVFVQHIMEICY